MRAFAAICAVLPLFLSGCGGEDSATGDAAASPQPSGEMLTAEIRDDRILTGERGAVTAIDAAVGDASAMPGDSNEAVRVETYTADDTNAASGSPPGASPMRPEEGDLLPSVAE